MFTKTPMQNYNKSNPLVIMCRRRYDLLYEAIHEYVKTCIMNMSIAVVITIINTTSMYKFTENIYITMIFLALSLLAFFTLLNFGVWCLKKDVYYSDAMKDFEEVSNKLLNDILEMNNEDVINCFGNLSIVFGRVLDLTKTFKFCSVLLGSMQVMVTLIAIVLTYSTY